MAKIKRPYCGGGARKYGKTSAGRQRWHRPACGATFVDAIDSAAKLPEAFLAWPLSGATQSEMPGEGRSFRRKASSFWEIWPMPPVVEERRRAVFVDGIYLARKIVARRMARHQGAEARVPCVLPGQEVHDDAPQAAGRGGAAPHC